MNDTAQAILGAAQNAAQLGLTLKNWKRQEKLAKEYMQYQNELALNLFEDTSNISFGLNEKAAQNADKRTRALYNDLYSPEAKVKQLKEAGLNVGLMYGGGGAGGTSSSSGAQGGASGQASMAQIAQFNREMKLENMQLAMMGAQIENIKAQTKNTEAKTDTETGANKRGELELENFAQDLQNKKAQESLTNAQAKQQEALTIAQGLQNAQNEEMFWDRIDELRYSNKKAYQEIRALTNQNDITEATKQAQIDTYYKNLEKINTEVLLNNAKYNLTKQEARNAAVTFNKIIQEIRKSDFDMKMSKEQFEWGKKEFNKRMAVQVAEGNHERWSKMSSSMWGLLGLTSMGGAGGNWITYEEVK